MVTDGAPQHRSRLVREEIGRLDGVELQFLPPGCPDLNAVEEAWRQGKQVLLVSEYYRTFADMCNAVTTYYRTVRFKLDILKFAHRKAAPLCTNLTICGGHEVFRWYRL